MMQAITFWKKVTMDESGLLESLIALLDEHDIRYCVIGGQAVNAYVEPLVSLDLDIVVAIDQLKDLETLLGGCYDIKHFAHSINVSMAGSDLRVQIQTDERYTPFIECVEQRDVLGVEMSVASLEDVLRGKIWAAMDSDRRGSKRQKDLADIARIIEFYPELRSEVPDEVLTRLF
jgi:hypothetical protein